MRKTKKKKREKEEKGESLSLSPLFLSLSLSPLFLSLSLSLQSAYFVYMPLCVWRKFKHPIFQRMMLLRYV
jgi:hypothetical protein